MFFPQHLIILSLVSLAAAAKLDNVYLPPHATASGGPDAGLQTPYQGGQSGYQVKHYYNSQSYSWQALRLCL